MKLFFLIPVYNHPNTLEQVVKNCLQHPYEVLLVDDGSDQETKKAIREILEKYPRVFAISLPQNQGKGAAVLRGFRWGISQGYTHAFQLDADAQQDPLAIPSFLRAAENHPQALILGYPVFNQRVPSARKWGRKVTQFWVIINTLSFKIKDALCGFRIYPLADIERLLKSQPRLGSRMDFDCDIVVQMAWTEQLIVNLPVPIDYPPDGISHFHPIENWYISKMHARLFLGMLRYLPKRLGLKK